MGNKSGVKAFRSEVDTLRNVIRKTVNEEIGKSLSGRKTPVRTVTAPAPDLKPLRERMARLETLLERTPQIEAMLLAVDNRLRKVEGGLAVQASRMEAHVHVCKDGPH